MDAKTDPRYEEFEVKGDDLVTRVREIVKDGNVSRLYIKSDAGNTIFEVPLTAGVAVAAAGALFSPLLVAVGALAAMVTHATIGVERPAAAEPTV
jgi:hypothetical protein